MAIVRYNPWSELDSVQRQINRMFNDVLPNPTLTELGGYSKYPAAELIETEEALILKLEVPGMKPEDIEIEATAKSISIKGDRKAQVAKENGEEVRSREAVSFRTEFRYGSFHRVISLPVRIQNTEVKAEYQDGILHLTLPKADEEKNKVVKVSLLGESNS